MKESCQGLRVPRGETLGYVLARVSTSSFPEVCTADEAQPEPFLDCLLCVVLALSYIALISLLPYWLPFTWPTSWLRLRISLTWLG